MSALTGRSTPARGQRPSVSAPPVATGSRTIAAAFGLIATAACASGSWIPSLWGDEAASLLSAQRSVPSLLRMLTNVDAVHGLYYLGLHGWIRLAGESPFAIRFPSAVAVGFAVAAITLLAGRSGGRSAAIAVGIAGCVLPRLTYAGEEARSYAFSAAAAAWLTLLLVWLVDGGGRDAPASVRRSCWALYGFGTAVAAYLFLYSLSLLLAHAAILALARAARPVWRAWVIAATSATLAVAPLLVLAAFERRQIAYLGRAVLDLPTLFAGLWFSTPAAAVGGWALILIAFGRHIRASGRTQLRRTWFDSATSESGLGPGSSSLSSTLVAGCWLLLPTGALLLANLAFPLYTPRYSTFAAPAAAVLVGEGALVVGRWFGRRTRVPTFAATGAALVAFAALCTPAYLGQRGPYSKANSDWSEVSAAVGHYARPGDAVVFDEAIRPSRRPRLAMHAYPTGFAAVTDVTLRVPFYENTGWADRVYSVPDAAAIGRFDGVQRVWLIEDDMDGALADYGLADLEAIGFEQTGLRIPTHRTMIIELLR